MSDDQKKIVPIDYTHRDFRSIREDLLHIAERFYADNFQDFSEASFGALMVDSVAYIADQLSFYLDYTCWHKAFILKNSFHSTVIYNYYSRWMQMIQQPLFSRGAGRF